MTALSQRPPTPRQCFAASNSCEGFKNYYGEVFNDTRADRLYIIKGGPGTGKSTLMKTLLGQKNVVSGEIAFGDGLKQNEIGYLPQQTPVQKDFPASVKEIVYSGCLNSCGLRPFYSKEQKKRANVQDFSFFVFRQFLRFYLILS